MTKLSSRSNEFANKLANREDVESYGSMRARWEQCPNSGRLTGNDFDQFDHARKHNQSLYVVYSYSTPIAWYDGFSTYLVERKFSATTSRHQSIARRALTQNTIPV